MAYQICLGSLAKVAYRVEYILLQRRFFSDRWIRIHGSIRMRWQSVFTRNRVSRSASLRSTDSSRSIRSAISGVSALAKIRVNC